MKSKDRKTRMALRWKTQEDRFIDELDRRLKYDWRSRCGDRDSFYDKSVYILALPKRKERVRSLVCSV